MESSILFHFCILSVVLITNALRTEGIYNGNPGTPVQRTYVAAIFAVKSCRIHRLKLVGSGVLVAANYVLSAAHRFVDLTSRGRYKLKSKRFYVRLGASNLYIKSGELLAAESFYLFGYNSTTGENDLILIKLDPPLAEGPLPWQEVSVATRQLREQSLFDGRVATHGMHNNTERNMDRKLRYAVANIVNNDQCDGILPESSQICIKMQKDDDNRPKGLCKYDGGAGYVIRDHTGYFVVGIAGKPKKNCDDTEKGAIYTDVRPFVSNIISIIHHRQTSLPAEIQVLQNNPLQSIACVVVCS